MAFGFRRGLGFSLGGLLFALSGLIWVFVGNIPLAMMNVAIGMMFIVLGITSQRKAKAECSNPPKDEAKSQGG